jgi:hypothetical protein
MVPRVTVKKSGSKVSRMFDGTFTPAISIEYGSYSEYQNILSARVIEIAERAIQSALHRRPLMKEFEGMELGRFILKQRIKQRVRIEDLAASINTKESWLRYLERNPRIAATASLPLILSMLNATNSSMTQKAGRVPELHDSGDSLDSDAARAVFSLVGRRSHSG